jgi:drug/metabolite transporter (DMT)-like permease
MIKSTIKKYVRPAFLLSITAAFIWACQIVLFRYQITIGENPYTLTLWSTAIELPFWIWILFQKKEDVKKLNPRTLGIFAIIGFGSAIAIGLMENLALANTTATNFAFLIRSVVLFTILFSAIFFKEPITKKKIVMTFTILAGAYLLNVQSGQFELKIGDIYTLIEAASIAFFTNILIKKMVVKTDPDFAAGMQYVMGSFFLLGVFIYQQTPLLLHNAPLLILYAIIGITFARLRNRAFQHATSTFVTMIMSFTPVFTFILSSFVLGETLVPIQLFGGFLIVLTGFMAEFLKI